AGAAQLRRRSLFDDLPAQQDHDAVADKLDLAQQVRVQQYRGSPAPQFLEQQAYGAAPGRVERARRLVQQQARRAAPPGLRHPEPLLHPLRHRLDAAVARLGEADELQQLAPFVRSSARAREALVQLEQLVGRVPAREAEELRQVAELAPGCERPRLRAADL